MQESSNLTLVKIQQAAIDKKKKAKQIRVEKIR